MLALMTITLVMGCSKSGYRRSCIGPPSFLLWSWCMLLIYFPIVLGSCLKLNITVAAYPQGDISIPYGQPLEIYCIAENFTSADLEFSKGGKIIPSEIVNSTARRLYIEKPEKQVNTYYCRNKKAKKTCASRVLVDSPPTNVTDFTCISKNLDLLNCSWSTSKEIKSSVNYNLTFVVNGNSVKNCNVKRIDNTRYCTWNASSQPRYRQLEETYYFKLVTCTVFGCNEQNFTIDHYSIVRPDPPSDLRVLSNGTHSVTLQWSIPNNMVDLLRCTGCGVEHRIEYQIAKIDNTTHWRSVNTSMLPPQNKTYRLQLNNLPYAHMQYEVRIYIKSAKAKKEELWSEFSYMFFYTASERPKRPPNTIVGAFHQSIYKGKRFIYMYWQQLEEYEEAGANFTYKVVVSSNHGTSTLYPEKNKSLSYVVLEDPSLEAMEVSVWSSNNMGSSLNSSHLYIPPERETLSLSLTSFTKLAYENGTYKLSWDGIDNIDNYTLFWCQHNTTNICTGRLNFTVLDSTKNNHMIDLPRQYRYQFAISVNKGTTTSGMVWANCDISKDGIAMYGFPVHLEHDVPGKTFVNVRWTMECALQDGIITGYSIAYCPIVNVSSPCDSTVGNKSYYINDPMKMDINITGLLPFRIYQFKIALNTTYGLKTIENANAITVVLTAEDTPTSPRNITISDIKNDSLVISWDPPLHRNGNIGKYVIYNYDKEIHMDKVEYNSSSRQIILKGLKGYTNYSLTVQACNSGVGLCSKRGPNDAIFVRTSVGPPSRINTPTVNNSLDILTWDPPEFSAGTTDQLKYQIKIIKDGQQEGIFNTTELHYPLTQCEGVVEGESYQVRALNFDEDPYHGVLAFQPNVILPTSTSNGTIVEYVGEWSELSNVACRSKGGLTMVSIVMAVFALGGAIYGTVKLYKKYRKMEDIKPDLPNGLHIPEKDITKYAFGAWNTTAKDDKSSSDELLLLPNNKVISTPEIKQKDDNCAASDHTDSTVLSDTSRGPVDRQASTSDDGSSSSLHLEIEPAKTNDAENNECDRSSSEAGSSTETTPYFGDKAFKKNMTSGYIQPVGVVNPVTGYVQSAPIPSNIQQQLPTLPPTTSYVMASLSPPIFTTGVSSPGIQHYPPLSTGYVRPQDNEARSMVNFPKLGPSPTKTSGPESLPTMPSLPSPMKNSADSSYIQLQSLDLPSLKPTVCNPVPLKQSASSGYVSPGDAVINKHLNNILSAGQLAEGSAILDPKMSPDAYCRFSWSVDPANDNLHTLLADSSINTPKD